MERVSIADQPVGVGFSYAEHGERVVSRFLVMLLKGCDNPVKSTIGAAAQDIVALAGIFFEHIHLFKGRALHMTGSYGVRVSRA